MGRDVRNCRAFSGELPAGRGVADFGGVANCMKRDALVERLVLNEICDDYENVDQIILAVAEGAAHGLEIDRLDVEAALGRLIAARLAKAYRLSPPSAESEAMPDVGVPETSNSTYFLATSLGLERHLGDEAWDDPMS